jgi:hypothetical protein
MVALRRRPAVGRPGGLARVAGDALRDLEGPLRATRLASEALLEANALGSGAKRLIRRIEAAIVAAEADAAELRRLTRRD